MSDEHLVQQRDFFLRSLRDLEAELEAGDIEYPDYVALRDDYTVRAAWVLRTLEGTAEPEVLVLQEHPVAADVAAHDLPEAISTEEPGDQDEVSVEPAPDAAVAEGAAGTDASLSSGSASRLARSKLFRWGVSGLVGAVAIAGSLWWVAHSSSSRLPGQTVSGSVSGLSAELQQANELVADGQPVQALQQYNKVLQADPKQPEALTAEGWLYAQAGLSTQGLELLTDAEIADPSYDLAHLYRGLVLLDDEHEPATAAQELSWYLAHGPEQASVSSAKSALAEANQQVAQQSNKS